MCLYVGDKLYLENEFHRIRDETEPAAISLRGSVGRTGGGGGGVGRNNSVGESVQEALGFGKKCLEIDGRVEGGNRRDFVETETDSSGGESTVRERVEATMARD